MDWAIGMVSVFWDGVFTPTLLPVYILVALNRGRDVVWVFSLVLIHALMSGGVDLVHVLVFSIYGLFKSLESFTSRGTVLISTTVVLSLVYFREPVTLFFIVFTLFLLLRRREVEG